MNILNNISVEQVETRELPLKELLFNCSYYPACGTDWNFIHHLHSVCAEINIISHVYVDYNIGDDILLEHSNKIPGYSVFATKRLALYEVFGIEGAKTLITHHDSASLRSVDRHYPFARWTIYNRDERLTIDKFPQRFSILYLGTEGVQTYHHLFDSVKHPPKVVGIINPGHGFGNNYTDFSNITEPFYKVLKSSSAGMPEFIFSDRIETYRDKSLDWPEYRFKHEITPYYTNMKGSSAGVNIYQHK